MEAPKQKLKLAFYWGASCGGCEISLLEIGAKILKVVEIADLVFCPCLVDTKYKDVEAMPDGYIDVAFYNGAVRSSENEHIAKLLRQKSKVLVAYGSCAVDGGIPALANLYTKEEIFHRAYHETPSTTNPDGVVPQPTTNVNGYELHLPEFYDRVYKLADVVKVDFNIPGCGTSPETTWNAIEQLVTGNLPEPGGVLGAGRKAVCEECPFEKKETRITAFRRPHTFIPPEKDQCLLEQGLVCLGPATRSGCGAMCLQARMPCRGCYGRLPEVSDQGAKLIAAIGSMIGSEDEKEIADIIGQIVDPAGTFYRFSMASSFMVRRKL